MKESVYHLQVMSELSCTNYELRNMNLGVHDFLAVCLMEQYSKNLRIPGL